MSKSKKAAAEEAWMQYAICEYLRNRRGFDHVCPGVGLSTYPDVVCVDYWLRLWEIEIKRSIGDLKADNVKDKHRWMRDAIANGPGKIRKPLAARFYFAVPEALWTRALPVVSEYYPHAGLMKVLPWRGYADATDFRTQNIIVVKTAKWIHKYEVSRDIIDSISSSLCNRVLRMMADRSDILYEEAS